MNEAKFDKIAQYLNGELSHEEQLDFESAMEKDEELAQLVKLYSTIEKEMTQQEIYSVNEAALKNTLSALNAKYFLTDHAQSTHRKTALKKLNFSKWLPYAVAASVIIAVGLFFLIKPSPQQLANDYIAQHLSVLSLTMAGTAADTMQAGISAYNNKEYNKAKLLFTGYYNNHPESSDAKKYTGFVYLTTKQYDSALYVFNDLSNIKGLYSNPGNFLKAVTLLKRNAEGDKEGAKQLLEQVVMQQSAGSKEAAEWLKQF
jgi:TolA-binding protein